MKTLMLYICAMIVGFLLAVALFVMVAIIALPIILMFVLDNWWVLLIYAPFIAYFTWQKTDNFFGHLYFLFMIFRHHTCISMTIIV